ncbi:ornithine cyclodeaminase family protein [Brucella pituitosa]|uniref:Ornithine cyclodeaminase family protein n=1 Tax=Brucella pituitosa TaxID=571256 RepID=A0A643EUX2_9HYPH|nr:ornithine cyclodeaminase family protein [Brucella pituitosa]KAB0566148.1 ornithine cyclodeaminase family protein [Brucella pituitosa]
MTITPVNLSQDELSTLLPMKQLIAALRISFTTGCSAPAREHHSIEGLNNQQGTLLLMPAWSPSGNTRFMGVKQVNIFPGNAESGKPALNSTYNLFDGNTGEHLAAMDGNTITGLRTVAVSALAADYLARPDAKSLLVLGSGRISSLIPDAYKAIRDIDKIKIWDINIESAQRLVDALRQKGYNCEIAASLEDAVPEADIISSATLSHTPLICGKWLRPGTHVDLIGAFTSEMRESDDECVSMAKVFIDTEEVFHEGGDIVQPIKERVINRSHVQAKLADLTSGTTIGRSNNEEITLFKAVGTALADLSAATLAFQTKMRE